MDFFFTPYNSSPFQDVEYDIFGRPVRTARTYNDILARKRALYGAHQQREALERAKAQRLARLEQERRREYEYQKALHDARKAEAQRQAQFEAQRQAQIEARRIAELEARQRAEEEYKQYLLQQEAERRAQIAAKRKAEQERREQVQQLYHQLLLQQEEQRKQQLEAQRKAEEEARQQLLLKQELLRKQKEEQQRKMQQAQLAAATTIQSWWRSITVQQKKLIPSLKQIKASYSQLNEIDAKYNKMIADKVNTSDDSEESWKQIKQLYIGFDDELTRLLIKLDDIKTNGSELIRLSRKQLVSVIQAKLAEIDTIKRDIEKVILPHCLLANSDDNCNF